MKSPCFPAQVDQKAFDTRVSAQDAKALWDYAKAQPYFSQGYQATIEGLFNDMNGKTPREWIVKTIDRNKTVRNAAAQMKIAAMERDNIRARARVEARYIDSPRLTQAAIRLNDLYRGWYTLWHGPVFPFTHAMSLAEMMLTDIPKAAYQLSRGMPLSEVAGRNFQFARMVKQTWENFLSPAEYVNSVNWMESHPRYTQWADAGGDIKMGRAPEGILGGKNITASMRAWEGMKPSRLMMMDSEMYDGDPRNPSQMTLKPQYAGETEAELERVRQRIASTYNHITGTMSPGEMGLPGGGVWFAGKLTSSKWQGLLGDTVRSIAVGTKGTGMTPADRALVSTTLRNMGGLFAAHTMLMALNEGMLKIQAMLGGPIQHVNWGDYGKSDWLSWKIGGYVIKPRGLIEPVQLLGRLFGVLSAGDEAAGRKPQSFGEQASRYFQYKLSPSAETGGELVGGKDIFGRPLPWGKNVVGKDVPETAFAPRYTYPEYALSKTPIFMSEGVREFYAGLRDNGINESDANAIIQGIMAHPKIVRDAAIQSAAAFVGVGMHRDYEMEQQ